MKISYQWLKSYVPDLPEEKKLRDIFTYHLCEVESLDKLETSGKKEDWIFDLNILPNRAHDLLSHQGIAREIASQLGVSFKLPDYKIPKSKKTNLKIKIETDNCRRYLGRIVRGIKIESSPSWVKGYLETIDQRSINNIVDTTNIVMYDCGQPCHVFDLDKLANEKIIIKQAKKNEEFKTLDGKEMKLLDVDMLIADEKKSLALAGIKGGKKAEIDENTKNILIEVANFNPVSVRKTSKRLGILTDSSKRFENNLSATLGDFAMKELSALILEMCPDAVFEDIVDTYPQKQIERKISFSTNFINKKLGSNISSQEIENILKNYHFKYNSKNNIFEIIVPPLRLDLEIPEDMVEEIGRIYGYDKIETKLPKIDFKIKTNEISQKIILARHKLLADGYSEVMTYTFRDKGEVEVLASASDKKFLRDNLADGLKESLELNQINTPLLEMNGKNEVKIFEIGTVFLKNSEEIHVAWNEKEKIIEMTLDSFVSEKISPEEFKNLLSTFNFQLSAGRFMPWSVYPFIARDVAVWVPEQVESDQVYKILKENAGELLIKDPKLFDEFKKDGKKSYAFRLVFQSYEKTLTDEEANKIMDKIYAKIAENKDWQVR